MDTPGVQSIDQVWYNSIKSNSALSVMNLISGILLCIDLTLNRSYSVDSIELSMLPKYSLDKSKGHLLLQIYIYTIYKVRRMCRLFSSEGTPILSLISGYILYLYYLTITIINKFTLKIITSSPFYYLSIKLNSF